jgi:DNA-binding CsgD family transcriptional regulator
MRVYCDFINLFELTMRYNLFLSKLPKWCREALTNSPLEYKNSFQNTSAESLSKLIAFFTKIDNLGVMGFGYRCFWENGKTSILAMNKEWHGLIQSSGFKLVNLAFVKSELLLAVRNNTNFLTRSRDKINNEYLLKLDSTSVNNGIVLYNYSRTRIDVFYFHCPTPEDRDFLLNKISDIQSLIDENTRILRSIIDSHEFHSLKTPCLNQEQRLICFCNNNLDDLASHHTNIDINGKNVRLSPAELECLFFLKFGSSVTYIAECVGRSTSAITDRIQSLKAKLNVQTKDELTLFARNELAALTKGSAIKNNINIRKII